MSKTNKMYLVTGAAGFLGSTVCRKLVDRNEKVRAFVLEGDKSAAYLPEEVEIVYGTLIFGTGMCFGLAFLEQELFLWSLESFLE